MTEGIRKEKNLPERIARTIILNEQLFIQDLKIFANTSIVGSQGVQSGGSSGGPSGVGNYLRKDGDKMDGPIAFQPSIASIVANQLDIRKSVGTNYTSKVFLIAESGTEDELNFILGGVAGNFLVGAEFPGQILVIQPIQTHKITINNDPSGVGDPAAVPPFNIRTPDGNPVVLENEQAVMLIWDSTSSQWSFLNAVASGLSGDPQCFTEKDLGDVSGAQTIVFNDNAFARMRAIGDTTLAFDVSSLTIGKWYKLTVEILQDETGGHIVTFTDAPFQNGVVPIVFKAANRYTTINFYAYTDVDGEVSIVRIFAFPTQFDTADQSKEFFDGYIQARLDTDQTANLTVSKHIEFDLPIATDSTIAVSTGSGQAAGLFTNFEVGHLYQCEVAIAVESLSQADSEFSFQFYNVTKAQFFGSQARALAVSNAEFDSSLVIAKGFFIADAINDTIEVRIKSMFGVNSIKAGDQSAEQMSYVVIKDCGVAGEANLPGNTTPAPIPDPPSTPLEAAVVIQLETEGGTHNLQHQFSHYTLRRCDIGSSSVGATLIGRKVTHIRMTVGNAVNGNKIYLAIYEGVGAAAELKSRSIEYDQSGMSAGQQYDVPLQTPYIIGTNDIEEIAICTAVIGGSAVQFKGDDTNSDRKRITYNIVCTGNKIPPDFPNTFACNESSLSNEPPEQRLINEDTIPGGIKPIT